jgi:hypothetical protein
LFFECCCLTLTIAMVATVPQTTPVVGLVQDYVSANLTAFVGKLIDTYANIGWVKTTCGYACRSVFVHIHSHSVAYQIFAHICVSELGMTSQ